MRNQIKMRSADFKFKYGVDKFEKLNDFLLNNVNMNGEEVQLLFSLTGIDAGQKVALDTKDDSKKEHSLSRTTYERNMVEMDRDFGLLTIADSVGEPYNDILNNKAFLKNSDEKVSFFSLPNVSTFYQYLLGGIDPLYHIVMDYGTEGEQIFDALYEYLVEDENIELMDKIAKQVSFE